MFEKIKTFFKIVFVIIILIVLAYVGLTVWQNRDNLPFIGEKEDESISSSWLEAEIASISEYTVLSYKYTNVGNFENDKEFVGWSLPFTKKSFIIKYDGEMKLGVDGTKIKVDISEASKEIIITLPYPEIMSHTIEEASIEVFDQSKNIFNQIEIEDYANFATDQKEGMEKRARDEGVFEQAQENAKEQIGGFIKNFPTIKEDYTVSIISSKKEQVSFSSDSSTSEVSSSSEISSSKTDD